MSAHLSSVKTDEKKSALALKSPHGWSPGPNAGGLTLAVLQAEKVHELNEEIGKLLAKAEQLGAEGNVDEAQKVLQEVEKVRSTKKDAEVRRRSHPPPGAPPPGAPPPGAPPRGAPPCGAPPPPPL